MLLYTLAFSALVAGALGHRPLPLTHRIVGGKLTTIDKHPHQISLEFLFYSNKFRHHCGGSIIGDNWVLTAAHCFSNAHLTYNYRIRAGSSYRERDGDLHVISDIIIHPDYDDFTTDYDVALIKVVEPFKFSQNIKAIPMVTETPALNSPVLTTGWGLTEEDGEYADQLMEVEVKVLDKGECDDLTDSMICAGVPEGGKDASQGDSGGPLIYNGKLAGVVSWGDGGPRRNKPSVYADVAHLRSWVSSITQIN